MKDTAEVDSGVIATVLMAYGAAGVVGSFAAGALAGRRLRGLVVGSVALPFLRR